MTVTKETIIKRIGDDTGWSRTDSKKAMQKLLGIMFRALSNGEDILISGFGKFKIHHKTARMGRNPHTLEEIELKARKIVCFKASDSLRRKTNSTLPDPENAEFAVLPAGEKAEGEAASNRRFPEDLEDDDLIDYGGD